MAPGNPPEESFTPELGQSLFGNKWETVECPRYVEDGIYALAVEITSHDDSLGLSYEYGYEFENDVFEMHRYYWDDCHCGFEQTKTAWHDANPHKPDCYQSELERRGAFDRDGNVPYEIRSKIPVQLAEEWGLPYVGCMVHCTCGQSQDFDAWRAEHDHDPKCGVVLPNFRHKESGFSVYWYKYMGRSQTMNRAITLTEWKVIRRECEDSLV